jgi:cyclopropane-fatty-acyl-phospholipid synthase
MMETGVPTFVSPGFKNSLLPQSRGQAPPRVTALDRWLVKTLLRVAGRPAVAVELWNGESFSAAPRPVVARFRVHDRRTLIKLLWSPTLGFGEAYMDGRVTVDGSLAELCEAVYRAAPRRTAHRKPRNTLHRARRNARHHYDLGNDFYQLWLDSEMVYTCAYYHEPAMTLAEAQIAKLDHVCRKLRLEPGQKVVEAGCGWGALALHLASRYGVNVTACNVSREQVAFARQRARDRGLADRVQFLDADWRDLTGSYDRFVSVGMLEHVGPVNYRALSDCIDRLLKPEGLGLIHSIGRNSPRPPDLWITKHIFPGGYVPDLGEIMEVFRPHEFSVLDVENLRLHYARTLEAWLANFEERVDDVRRMFDERFVRMWRLYLAGSLAAFRAGEMQLFQIVFARPRSNQVPMTRDDLYAS